MKIQPSPFWKGEATPHQMRHDTLVIGSSIAFSKIFLGRGLQILSLVQRCTSKGDWQTTGWNEGEEIHLFYGIHSGSTSVSEAGAPTTVSTWIVACAAHLTSSWHLLFITILLLEQHMLSTCGWTSWKKIMNALSWASKSSQRKISFLPC